MESNRSLLNRSTLLGTALAASLLVLGTGCEPTTSGNGDTKAGGAAGELQLVSDFPDQVVIPTYKLLVEKSATLKTTVETFVTTKDEATLKAAQSAWNEARTPWEQSEAFAFGPAESLGYDGDLDDWPVNEADLKKVLASSDPITAESVKKLQTTEKGFHTIEWLLFGNNNDKKAGDFTDRQLEYLKQLAIAFDQTSKDLVTSWEEGIDGKPAYKTVLATAGDKENQSYPTTKAGLEEIVQGIIGCMDEVGNEKIGGPLEEKTTDNLESRYSHTSLDDFKNNIISAENAYLGKVPAAGSGGASLSEWVAKQDADLDAQVKKELKAAQDAVAAVPNPLEPKIADGDALTKLEAAKTAVLVVHSTFKDKVLPLVVES